MDTIKTLSNEGERERTCGESLIKYLGFLNACLQTLHESYQSFPPFNTHAFIASLSIWPHHQPFQGKVGVLYFQRKVSCPTMS
jgi:hypothetical protein